MRRLTLLLLPLLLLLCSCEVDERLVTPVTEAFTGSAVCDYGFALRIERSGGACIIFAEGGIEVSESPYAVYGTIEQTMYGEKLGTSVISFSDGVFTADDTETEMTEEEFRAQLIYSPPLLFGSEDIKSAEIINTLSGTLYRWYIKDFTGSERLYALLGEGLPHTLGLAAVIEDETRFTDIVCEYTVSDDGNPVSYALTLTAVYQDTPPYVPGSAPKKSNYQTAVSVDYRVEYKRK